MNALSAEFGFTVASGLKTLSLRQGNDFRIYPTARNKHFGDDLTARQIDLIRIATVVHVADGWARREAMFNRLRNPKLEIEVLDPVFWLQPVTMGLLKSCVDFVSGGDDWQFSFIKANNTRHERCRSLFRGDDHNVLVCPYSGGLDSASGLAIRAAEQPERRIVPVTVRHQMQKSQLVRKHFNLLMNRGFLKRNVFNSFQAGAFIRNGHIKREYGAEFRESTHRCRSFLFMTVAGLVANSLNASEVEVLESGVGSINLPLVGGPADYRTTRSTHPTFLRLLSALVSHVNDADVKYVLPFADETKAEMVGKLKSLGLEELARMSVSCIMHPYKRKGWQQCGHCAACVYRRQAMFSAGITEEENAYGTDLFAEHTPGKIIPAKRMGWIKAFHQQIARLRELDLGEVPASFRRYLITTEAVSSDEEIPRHAEVYRRYRQEWLALISEARRCRFPWMTPAPSRVLEGAT